MDLFLERQDKKLSKKFSGKAGALLKELGVNSEEVLIVRNGEVVGEDATLEDTDKVELLSVVSGG